MLQPKAPDDGRPEVFAPVVHGWVVADAAKASISASKRPSRAASARESEGTATRLPVTSVAQTSRVSALIPTWEVAGLRKDHSPLL